MPVVFDADLDMATNAIMGAGYGSAGERCMALSVAVVVGDETGDQLIEKLKNQIKTMRVGPAITDGPENDMGPVITAEHKAKICDYITTGEQQGASLLVDGRTLTVDGHEACFFCRADFA
jgi:malonate-semialdehyde dehydrogenase (acetylating)/methylmalonate-semialdehyde dehydrogenase